MSETFPHVYFWDQPPVHQVENAFLGLLDSVANQIAHMEGVLGQPIKLMAHSFGGHVASALLDRVPELIGDCHLLATGHDILGGFRNLLNVMVKSPNTDNSLIARMSGLLEQTSDSPRDTQLVWEYIDLAFSNPDVVRHYWTHEAQYQTYKLLSATAPPLDFLTYKAVLNDFLENHSSPRSPFQGSQRILIELGDQDPVLSLDTEQFHWKTRFPTAEILLRPGADHFLHLEPYIGRAQRPTSESEY